MKRRFDEAPGKSEGVIAVDRALAILDAFHDADRSLALVELSRRTALDKATILRLAKSLAKGGHLVRNTDATWRLGPKLAQLGARYQATFQIRDSIEPALVRLGKETGETITFYVREQDRRICLFRVDSPQSIRHHARIGDILPLDHGAPGHVLLAFGGEKGEAYDEIRRRLHCVSLGDRDPQVGCVSCPVFQADRSVLGVVSVVGPIGRFGPDEMRRHLTLVFAAAAQLSSQFGYADAYSQQQNVSETTPFVIGPREQERQKLSDRRIDETVF